MKKYSITLENIDTKKIIIENISLSKPEYNFVFDCLLNKTLMINKYIIKQISSEEIVVLKPIDWSL